MKKAIQENENAIVKAMYERFEKSLEENGDYYVERLRSCSATVRENTDFIILVSYNTVVAIVDKATGNLYDFLRYVYGYTATSAQHISKFAHDYSRNGLKYTYRAV